MLRGAYLVGLLFNIQESQSISRGRVDEALFAGVDFRQSLVPCVCDGVIAAVFVAGKSQ